MTINIIFFIINILLLLIIAYDDLTKYKIKNINVIIILALFIIYNIIFWPGIKVISFHMLAGICMLAFGLFFYNLKMLGAGDVKLFTVLAFWFGPLKFLYCFIITSLFGLLFLIAVIFFRMIKEERVKKYTPILLALHRRKKGFPYGVAISFGAIVTFYDLFINNFINFGI